MRLVSRFRSSQAFAAASERTSERHDSGTALELEVRNRARREIMRTSGSLARRTGSGHGLADAPEAEDPLRGGDRQQRILAARPLDLGGTRTDALADAQDRLGDG